MEILIVNGPNLNLLGTREPEIYGRVSMEQFLVSLKEEFSDENIDYFQSNSESELLNRIQKNDFDSLVINPGAFTHYSYALADCLKNISQPIIEVHISNLYKREVFRHKSVTAPYALGLISGLGLDGYRLALLQLLKK